jgi:hypothetical protein
MVIELLSYKVSILNPLLKWITLCLFVLAASFAYRSRFMYGGKLQQVATLLLLGGIVGILAAVFRIAGDFFVQWKWAESIFFLALAVITLVISYTMRRKFKSIIALFEAGPGGEGE